MLQLHEENKHEFEMEPFLLLQGELVYSVEKMNFGVNVNNVHVSRLLH
jgi:hypothetical protein